MGATSSISVPGDHAEKLSQESIRDFKEFEDSLCSKNLSSEELQALLTTKFTELLALEKKRASLMKPSNNKEATLPRKTSSTQLGSRKLSHHAIIAGKAKSDSPAKPRGGSMRCCLDPEAMRKVRLEERQRIHETYSSKRRSSIGSAANTSSKKHTASAPLLPSSSVDSLDTMNEEFSFNRPVDWDVCATHTDDGGDLAKTLRAIDLTAASSDAEHDLPTDDESSCDEHDLSSRSHDSNAKVNSTTPKLKKVLSSIPESYECRLCKKKFPSKALLDTHLTHSQIHRQALLELRKKYAQIYADVERMDKVMKRAASQFYSILNMQRKLQHQLEEQPINTQRWRRAVRKVISQNMVQKVTVAIQDMEEVIPEPSLFHTALLIGEDSKFFWRLKTRYSLALFYHEVFNVIEIVPQIVTRGNAAGNAEETSTVVPGEGEADATPSRQLPRSSSTIFQPCQRIYLDSRIVLEAAQAEAKEREKEETRKMLAAQGMVRAPDAEEDVESADQAAVPDSNVKSLANMRVLCVHILDRLKVDFVSVHGGGKSLENTLFFDDAHYPVTSSPVLRGIPPGVRPVALSGTVNRVYEEWEMKEKLQELAGMQRELSVAVLKAEEIAQQIITYTPKHRGGVSGKGGNGGWGSFSVDSMDNNTPDGFVHRKGSLSIDIDAF